MKKSFQDSGRLQLALNDSLNAEDNKLYHCSRDYRKRDAATLGSQLFGPHSSLSPMYRKHSPNVFSNESTTPGASSKGFVLPPAIRSERKTPTMQQLTKNYTTTDIATQGMSPIAKRLFENERISMTPQNPPGRDGDIQVSKFFTQGFPSDKKVTSAEVARAKKWIHQCISDKKKKKQISSFQSKLKKGPKIGPYSSKTGPQFSKKPMKRQGLFEMEEEGGSGHSDRDYRSATQNLVENVQDFRQLLNEDMIMHKNVSYKTLSQKWSRVQLLPHPLENISLTSYFQQSELPENKKFSELTNRALEKFSKKDLWVMAIEMERKISQLIDNGIHIECTNQELTERIAALQTELLRTRKQAEEFNRSMSQQNTSLSRRTTEQKDMIEKLFHEKDELSHSCRELSEALTSVRTQHDASIQNLKDSFQARFTSKLMEVYDEKQKQIQMTKQSQQEDLKKMMEKYQESIQKFRRKYNMELEGIQKELNIKSTDQSEVEDRMVHLKCFVQDLINRLKSKEVRCFELESQILKLKESYTYVSSEKATLQRTLAHLKQNYKEGLQKLKKEYRRNYQKGLDTLTAGGFAKLQQSPSKSEKADELSIHGHIKQGRINFQEDLIMQRINGLISGISGVSAEH